MGLPNPATAAAKSVIEAGRHAADQAVEARRDHEQAEIALDHAAAVQITTEEGRDAFVGARTAEAKGKTRRTLIWAGAVLGVSAVAASTGLFVLKGARDEANHLIDKGAGAIHDIFGGALPHDSTTVETQNVINHISIVDSSNLVQSTGTSAVKITQSPKIKVWGLRSVVNPIASKVASKSAFAPIDATIQLGTKEHAITQQINIPRGGTLEKDATIEADVDVSKLTTQVANQDYQRDKHGNILAEINDKPAAYYLASVGATTGTNIGKLHDDRRMAVATEASVDSLQTTCDPTLKGFIEQGVQKHVQNIYRSVAESLMIKGKEDVAHFLGSLANRPIKVVFYRDIETRPGTLVRQDLPPSSLPVPKIQSKIDVTDIRTVESALHAPHGTVSMDAPDPNRCDYSGTAVGDAMKISHDSAKDQPA